MTDRRAKEEVNPLAKGQVQLYFMGARSGGENQEGWRVAAMVLKSART